MNNNEKGESTKKVLRNILSNINLTVDTIGQTIERRFLTSMIEEGQKYANEIMEDYEFLVSPNIKEIVLLDYRRVTENLKALRYVEKHHKDAIPSLGGIQGTYKDAMI